MTYSPTQLEVIKVFSIETFLGIGYYNGKEIPKYCTLKLPHLEDVFRVAQEKGFHFEMGYRRLSLFGKKDTSPEFITFNPTISLLEQPESVLIELLNIFK